jgi:hypothetical protein
VTGVVALPGRDAADFLDRAVAFANGTLDGTLGACILVDPATERALGPALERAIAALRYGTVGVNVWPAIAFALGATPWGAYPGHTLADVGSGIGTVHDPLLLRSASSCSSRGSSPTRAGTAWARHSWTPRRAAGWSRCCGWRAPRCNALAHRRRPTLDVVGCAFDQCLTREPPDAPRAPERSLAFRGPLASRPSCRRRAGRRYCTALTAGVRFGFTHRSSHATVSASVWPMLSRAR